MKVKRSVGILVEIDAPANELPDLPGGALDDLIDRLGVAQPVARDHRIVDMFVEIIDLQIGH